MVSSKANRPSKLYVDLKAIAHNLNEVRMLLSPKTDIMTVIKASAYGGGSLEIAKALAQNGIKRFAVAIPEEGAALRNSGINKPILVLTPPMLSDLQTIVDYDLIPSIPDIETAKKLDELCSINNKKIKTHIEIDTGMGRTGIQPQEAICLTREIQNLPHLEVEGLFSHFSSAESDADYTKKQITVFEETLNELKSFGINIPIRHVCNSAGITLYPEAHYEFVRLGLMLYGYYPDKSLSKKISLKPSLTLKTDIIHIKEVPPQTSISYNQTFITNRTSRIATLPIGYADGLKRSLSNKGSILVNGQRAPVIGRICMDLTMIDVTDITNVKKGDQAVIFDNTNITVEEIADLCGTINYEIISTISPRIPRVYME
ncbi:MAG: alanine racemase [Deltaproteobacteria bacterium]